MKLVLVLLLAISMASARRQNKTLSQFLHSMDPKTRIEIEEDARLNTLQLAWKYGYDAEEHSAETEDGYILKLHRILPNRQCDQTKNVVLLQHGLLGSSASWVLLGPEKALAYLLSDACYDVWMGNSRGNKYSRHHKTITTDSHEFWDFSWHEMGIYDLPATINTILSLTDTTQLNYVGHSQGATSFFVLTSLHPEYKDKIEDMFALSPVAYMGNSKSVMINLLAHYNGIIELLASAIGVNELLPSNAFTSMISGALCSDDLAIAQSVCTNLAFALFGYDAAEMNTTLLPVILGHVPAGASSKTFLHSAQLVTSGKFQMYDYGEKTNWRMYGQPTPPEYPLENIEIPVNLWWGENDLLTAPEDINTLLHQLQSHHSNLAGSFKVPWKLWNHLDFVFGKNAKDFIYIPIIKIMDNSGRRLKTLEESGKK